MQSSIQDEINSNLKELITMNKLQTLSTIFLSNEINEFQNKLLTEIINSNEQQRKFNEQQRQFNEQQSKFNEQQAEYNKNLGETLKEALSYLKDIKNSQNSN